MLPVTGTTLTLSGLSISGNILLPIGKDESDRRRIQKESMSRNQLIAAARKGDEDAIESLTLEDMDIYSTIQKDSYGRRIQSGGHLFYALRCGV